MKRPLTQRLENFNLQKIQSDLDHALRVFFWHSEQGHKDWADYWSGEVFRLRAEWRKLRKV